jgi:hypothetical protein
MHYYYTTDKHYRGVGDGGGVGGIWGLLAAVGEPVSGWQRLPPSRVVGDVFARTFRGRKGGVLTRAPLATQIMFGLARQVQCLYTYVYICWTLHGEAHGETYVSSTCNSARADASTVIADASEVAVRHARQLKQLDCH